MRERKTRQSNVEKRDEPDKLTRLRRPEYINDEELLVRRDSRKENRLLRILGIGPYGEVVGLQRERKEDERERATRREKGRVAAHLRRSKVVNGRSEVSFSYEGGRGKPVR